MRTLVFHWHLPYNHHQIKRALFIQCCAICSNPPIKILWLDLCKSFCKMVVTSNMATTPPSSNSPALTAHAFFVRRGIRVWPWAQSLRPNQGSASVWRKKLKWAKKLLTDTFLRVCALHCFTKSHQHALQLTKGISIGCWKSGGPKIAKLLKSELGLCWMVLLDPLANTHKS